MSRHPPPGSVPGSPSPNPRRFERRPAKPTVNPRRVSGGMKLARTAPVEGATPWVVQRWMRLVEGAAPGDQLAEGLEYARVGQTRTLEMTPGAVVAGVQGRMARAYETAVRLPVFSHEQWSPVVESMISQARYAAALLGGDLPANIEDVFAPAGLQLFPAGPADLAVTCTCVAVATAAGTPPQRPPWCKHACCVMALAADRLAADPFLIFLLRGMPKEELLERLRQRRAASVSLRTDGGGVPVYTPHLPGLADAPAPPLETDAAAFWHPGPEASGLDFPIEGPEVPHPLLRRMGPSPFTGAKFPLAGLLATCYDVIGREALRGIGEVGGGAAGDEMA